MLNYFIPIKVKLHLPNNPHGNFKTIRLYVCSQKFLLLKLSALRGLKLGLHFIIYEIKFVLLLLNSWFIFNDCVILVIDGTAHFVSAAE